MSAHALQVAMICESGSAHIHPFKERMETFIDSGMIK